MKYNLLKNIYGVAKRFLILTTKNNTNFEVMRTLKKL